MTVEQRKDKILDMLEGFKKHGVSHEGNGLKKINDFADLVMQADQAHLEEIEAGLNKDEREHLLWVCSHSLGMDSFLSIVRMIAVRWSAEEVSHICDELNTAEATIHQLDDVHSRLKTENELLEGEFQAMKVQADVAEREVFAWKERFMIVTKKVILMKMENGDALSADEREFVKENL